MKVFSVFHGIPKKGDGEMEKSTTTRVINEKGIITRKSVIVFMADSFRRWCFMQYTFPFIFLSHVASSVSLCREKHYNHDRGKETIRTFVYDFVYLQSHYEYLHCRGVSGNDVML